MERCFVFKPVRLPAAWTQRQVRHVPAAEAFGLLTAAPLFAPHNVPLADVSARDGWAVGTQLTAPGTLPVFRITGTVANGTAPQTVAPGCALRINTGGAVPHGAVAVIPDRQTAVDPAAQTVASDRTLTPGQYIRHKGDDWRAGTALLPADTLLGAAQIALLTETGLETVPVYRAPSVTLIATGSELTGAVRALPPAAATSAPGSALYLQMLFRACGVRESRLIIVPDQAEIIARELKAAAAVTNFVITTGGTGRSAADLSRDAARLAGAGLLDLGGHPEEKPPFVTGEIGEAKLIGLPGNPLGAAVIAQRLLVPLFETLLRGMPSARLPEDAVLTQDLPAKAGDALVKLVTGEDGQLLAVPVLKGSGPATVYSGRCATVTLTGTAPVPAGTCLKAVPFLNA